MPASCRLDIVNCQLNHSSLGGNIARFDDLAAHIYHKPLPGYQHSMVSHGMSRTLRPKRSKRGYRMGPASGRPKEGMIEERYCGYEQRTKGRTPLTARKRSPILPPGLRYVTVHRVKTRKLETLCTESDKLLRSVDTPVANKPFDATAKDPPRSTARKGC